MKQFISEIINALLKGKDYRVYVLAVLNTRFIDTAMKLITEVFHCKLKNEDWISKIIEHEYTQSGSDAKTRMLWFSGMNEKTVKNMAGTAQKEVCFSLGKQNIKAFRMLFNKSGIASNFDKFAIIIEEGETSITLDAFESLFLINILATMKVSIQGGIWSETGKII